MVELELESSVVSLVDVGSSVVDVVSSVVELDSSAVSVVDDVGSSVVDVDSSVPDVVESSVDVGVVKVGPDDEVVVGVESVDGVPAVVGVVSGSVDGATGPGPVLTVVGFSGTVVGVVWVVMLVLSTAATADVDEAALAEGSVVSSGSEPALGTRVVRMVSTAMISAALASPLEDEPGSAELEVCPGWMATTSPDLTCRAR